MNSSSSCFPHWRSPHEPSAAAAFDPSIIASLTPSWAPSLCWVFALNMLIIFFGVALLNFYGNTVKWNAHPSSLPSLSLTLWLPFPTSLCAGKWHNLFSVSGGSVQINRAPGKLSSSSPSSSVAKSKRTARSGEAKSALRFMALRLAAAVACCKFCVDVDSFMPGIVSLNWQPVKI